MRNFTLSVLALLCMLGTSVMAQSPNLKTRRATVREKVVATRVAPSAVGHRLLNETPTADQLVMRLTKSKQVGDTIRLSIDADSESRVVGAMLVGEVGEDDYAPYKLEAQTVEVRGDVFLFGCAGNALTQIDLSGNPTLQGMDVSNNNLTQLDLNHTPNFVALMANDNQLATVDLSVLPDLAVVGLNGNPLTALDVTRNEHLNMLFASGGKLKSLDLSNNFMLQVLEVNDNQLEALDVSTNFYLDELSCARNQIAALDLTYQLALASLDCSGNGMTHLLLPSNPTLQSVVCHGNRLSKEQMHQLVEMLPDNNGEVSSPCPLVVFDPANPNEGNVMAEEDVAAANAKYWNVVTPSYQDYKGVTSIASAQLDAADTTAYDLSGRPAAPTHRGVKIVKTPQGKALKVLKP